MYVAQIEQVNDLASLTRWAAENWGDDPALVFDPTGETIGFRGLHARVVAFATLLRARGVREGDNVGVLLANRIEYPVVWLGIITAGAAMVPLSTEYKSNDAAFVLTKSQVTCVVTSEDLLTVLDRLELTPSWSTILVEDTAVSSALSGAGDSETTVAELPFVGPETLANVQFTSGTTGNPKGCMLSNLYWVLMGRRIVDNWPGLDRSDVLFTAQPFYYMDPQWNLTAGMLAGACTVFTDKFRPAQFWETVRRHRVTFFYCLGAMPALLLKQEPNELDRQHSVRVVLCSAIPSGRHRDLEERYGAPWYEGYGMTETGSSIRMHPDEHDEFMESSCIGRANLHREARAVDANDRPVPRGQVGELVLRGIGMMDGYYDEPEATQRAFRNGWFHTGDLVWMDEEDRVFFSGRSKDMIRRGGQNISAAEVEATITAHPAVRLAACVAVHDELMGEEVRAYVELQGDSPGRVMAEELAEYCSERLARFKVPRYWVFRDQLPVTPSERVAKKQLVSEPLDPADEYDRRTPVGVEPDRVDEIGDQAVTCQ